MWECAHPLDFHKAWGKMKKLLGDTSMNAHKATWEYDNFVFWYTENALPSGSEGPKSITMYAWMIPAPHSRTTINSCVMQPGHIGKIVHSVPKNAKPCCPKAVAMEIVRMCDGERPAFERFFPTIDEEFIDAMQDCVDATWLCSLPKFSAAHADRAERLYTKVEELNW